MIVKLYSIAECPYCNMVREILNDKGIEYEEYDLLENEGIAREIVMRVGKFCVPILDVDGALIVGFNRERIEQIISDKILGGIVRR